MDLEHERRLTDVEARSKSNTKRLDDMEKRQVIWRPLPHPLPHWQSERPGWRRTCRRSRRM